MFIKINKIEAAQRQIEVAIRLLFDNEDPVAIHTLAMAGFRILRDVASKKGSNMHNLVQAIIKPGMESKFWWSINSFANFLKHAENDPDAIIDSVDEEVNDAILLMASLYYQDLGHQLTPEMLALVSWYMAIRPEFLLNDKSNAFQTQLMKARDSLIGKPRIEQLKHGKYVLYLARKCLC